LRALIAERLKASLGENTIVARDTKKCLSEVRTKLSNLVRATKAGGDFQPILDRMAELRREEERLLSEQMNSLKRSAARIDIDQAVEDIAQMSKRVVTLLSSHVPATVKHVLPRFLNRVEVDPIDSKATFFVYRIPRTSTTYDKLVSVATCRRSDFNTDFNERLLVVSRLHIPRRRCA
jgi:hypothetical protein